MASPNVAMFIPFNFPAYGGTELATYNLVKELHTQKLCNARIWSFKPKNESNILLNSMNDVSLVRYSTIDVPKIKDFSLELPFALNNSEDEILHFQGAHRLLSRLILERLVHNKIKVLTTHALHESYLIINSRRSYPFILPFFISSLKSLDHIIALSKTDMSLLISMGIKREKITIIPNGINESKFKGRRKFLAGDGKIRLLSVGRFDYNKNFEAVVEITARLSKSFNVETYLVGSLANKAYFDKIIRLVKANKLEQTVKIYPSLDQDALIDCYKSCDIFIFPSLMETSPIALLEAMYAGLPIVASNVGAISELVTNGVNGYLSPPHDVERMYKLTIKLLKESNLRREMGTLNHRIAKKYTWSRVALATNALYQKLINA